MQIFKANKINKYDLFEKDFQIYFVLSKSLSNPKPAQKDIVLKAKNIITNKTEKISFDFEAYLKADKPQKKVLSFLYEKSESLIFFDSLSMQEVILQKLKYLELVPFLQANLKYDFFEYNGKICFVKPINIFMEVSLEYKNFDIFKKDKQVFENALKSNQQFVKIDTRKYF